VSEQSLRRTQARVAERERRRKQEEQKGKLLKIVPLTLVAILAVAGIGYAVLTSAVKPPRAANAAVIGPRLEVDREQLDLGDRKLNVPVRASFNVKNAGDDTLNLVVPQVVTALEGC
jgi:flagellar basal body-associated protein FliL